MDRLDMYKTRIRNNKSNQQQRRFASNQYRSVNRANEYLNRRQIEISPSPLLSNGQIIPNSSTARGNVDLNLKNINTKSITKEKKLSYKERFIMWKQEKIQKENNLEQKKKNEIKPFVSTVRPNNGIFNAFNELTNERNKFQFKKPLLPPTTPVAATNGIKNKDKKPLKNSQNNILNPSNGNGVRNIENNFKEKCNIVIAQKNKPLSTTTSVAATNGIKNKDKKPLKNSQNNILSPSNGNGIRNIENKFKEKFNIVTVQKNKPLTEVDKASNPRIKLLGIPTLNQSYVTSTAKKSQQLISSTTSTSLTLSTSAIVSTGESNEKPNNETFIKEDEDVISPIDKSLENLHNLNGKGNNNYETSEISKDFPKHHDKQKNNGNDNNDRVELKKWNDKNRKPLTKAMKKRKEHKILKDKLKSTDFMEFMKKVEIDFTNECLKNRDNDGSKKNAKTEEDPILTSLRYSVRLLDKRSLKDKLGRKQNELTARRLSTPKQIRMQKIVKQQEQNIIRSRSKSPKQQEKANNNNERNKTDDGSKISQQPVYKTTTKTASLSSDCSERPSNYVSPYVSLSRGKVSLKKEMVKRNSLYKTDCVALSSPVICDSIKIRHTKEAIKYFRGLLTSEMQRLNELCNKWESYQNNKNLQKEYNNDTNQMLIHEDNCNDMINVTIGQTKLLLNKKLKQFNDLIDKCEKYTIPKIKLEELKVSGKHENDDNMKANTTKIFENVGDNIENIKLILPEDLEGFWSMVYLQVENIDKRFLNLDRWKENDWKDPDEIKAISNTKPNIKKKQIQQKKNKMAGNGGSKDVRNMLKAFKHNFKFNKKSNDDMIFISNPNENENEVQIIKLDQNQHEQYVQITNNNKNENHESTPIQKTDVLPLTPLRRSARLLNKSNNNNSIQKSTKQARIQKIIERNSRSRSNTPQKNTSPLCPSAIPRSIIKQNSIKNSKSTSEKLKLCNVDKIAYTPNRKSILKPPNSNVKSSVKRCVAFADAEHVIQLDDINNEISGINLLNTSPNSSKYVFLEH